MMSTAPISAAMSSLLACVSSVTSNRPPFLPPLLDEGATFFGFLVSTIFKTSSSVSVTLCKDSLLEVRAVLVEFEFLLHCVCLPSAFLITQLALLLL